MTSACVDKTPLEPKLAYHRVSRLSM